MQLALFRLAAIAAFAACNAQAEVIELAPLQDNTMFEEGNLSNGAGRGLFIGRTGSTTGEVLRRALIEFDVSVIPREAIINSVELRFEITKYPTQGLPNTATLHKLHRDWGEATSNAMGNEGGGAPALAGDVTWQHTFFDGEFWDTAGGDFEPLPSSSAAFTGGGIVGEPLVFETTPELVSDVRSWIVDASSNHGWIVRGDEANDTNARRLASRECPTDPACVGLPPKLVVDYSIPSPVDHLVLTELTDGLTNPIGVVNAGDGSGRLFIVEQEGVIRIYDAATDTLLGTPFLDIQSEVYSLLDPQGGNEQGLLGLAFHPDYASNGRFFVNYTTNPSANVWHTVVAEFEVSGDPNVAMGIGSTVLEFEQEARNHNGGDMHFGPDGFLYIASGDGGGGGDTYGNAQDLGTLRGAMLRIDVDGSPPQGAELCGIVNEHGIPPGNPFPGTDDGCDEILHYGLRNPWRFSFDAFSGDLWIADVGQNAWEEINRVPGSAAGLNFGWPCREGRHDFDDGATCEGPLTEPVLEYPQTDGNCSVTGGFLYRGNRLPLSGRYVFGDYCSGRIWIASGSDDSWSSEEWPAAASTLDFLSSFGQGENCALYLTERSGGRLYRIDDTERLLGAGFESRLCR